MIRLRMGVADLQRVRFAYSPLAEVAESLYLLSSGQVQPVHLDWYRTTRDRLRRVDTALLAAVVPARPTLAKFLFAGVSDPATTIDQQLQAVTEYPVDRFRGDLEAVWLGEDMPPAVRVLVAEGSGGVRRLAGVLWEYWQVAIGPHWREIRAVLDEDVAFRASRLTRGGIAALFSDLHPELSVEGQGLRIDKRRHAIDQDLSGGGLLLVPSVFAWPNLVVMVGVTGPPSLTYAARGVGTLWGEPPRRPGDDDALGALLGRARAAILMRTGLPRSTTELALELGQSAPSVSGHLAVLRRSGLVTSWRSGRRILYQQTPLGTSVVLTSSAKGVGPADSGIAESLVRPRGACHSRSSWTTYTC